MKQKFREWFFRYAPANICALIGTLLAAYLVFLLTHNLIIAAFAGTIGDGIGYYVCIIFGDIRASLKKHRANKKAYTYKSFLITLRNMLVEFGPSEIIDTFIIRPAIMYFTSLYIAPIVLGWTIGKYAADIIFYIPVVISYELRKKYLKE
ncbi:MAG: hypothetical protein WC916_01130 [Candidatus Woesearchaeota archaeon]